MKINDIQVLKKIQSRLERLGISTSLKDDMYLLAPQKSVEPAFALDTGTRTLRQSVLLKKLNWIPAARSL